MTVYLNEQKIISQYLLLHRKFTVKIVCQKGVNEILLFANNLGSEPPNTASIAISQNGNVLRQIIAKSDAFKSESFIIKR